MTRLVVPADILAEAAKVLVAAYPFEACGWLLERGGVWRVQPVPNCVMDVSSALAKHRFEMAPAALIRVLREADDRAERLAVMFHGHVDAPPRPSDADRAAWAPHGVPLYPGVALAIGEVRADGVAQWQAYRWWNSALRAVPLDTG